MKDDKYIEVVESSLAISPFPFHHNSSRGESRMLPLGRMRLSCPVKGRDLSMIKGRIIPINYYIQYLFDDPGERLGSEGGTQ